MDSFADTYDDPAEAYMLKKVYWQGKKPPFHNNDFPFTLALRQRLGATNPLTLRVISMKFLLIISML